MRILTLLSVIAVTVAGLMPDATAAEHQEHLARGYSDLKIGRHQSAVAEFTQAIETGELTTEELLRALSGRASAYSALGKHELAAFDYEAAIGVDPMSAEAFNGRGLASTRLSRLEDALADFDAAIRIEPNREIYYLNRGGTYAELGRFEEAIRDLDTAVGLNPSFGLLWYSRGLIYEQMGDRESAKSDFERAYALLPDYPPIGMKAREYGLVP